MNAKSETTLSTGAHRIWEALLALGVDTVFGYPGGAIMPAYDAMAEYPIRHILTRHEQGASYMADGYARAKSRRCHCNLGPRCYELGHGTRHGHARFRSRLCITGKSPTVLGTNAFQEVDVGELRNPSPNTTV